MGRLVVAITTLVGGVGLGLAFGYLALVAAAFAPGGDVIADFMIGSADTEPGYGFALVVIPYVLLLVHLWLRLRVAAFLVDRGELPLAEKYAAARLRASALRSRREATANRAALMRVALRRGEYHAAVEWTRDAPLPRRGPQLHAIRRWHLETLLRLENLVAARELIAATWPVTDRGEDAGAFCACAGEIAVRADDAGEWREWRDRARYADADGERLQIVEAFAAVRFPTPDEERARLATFLGGDLDWLREIPLAAGEVAAMRSALVEASGDEHAAAAIRAGDPPCDARSEFVLGRRESRDTLESRDGLENVEHSC